MGSIQDYSIYATNLFALLDKYLIKDLETLINEIPGRSEGGGVGYPALQTLLSSMELLGLLLSGETQARAFQHYWRNVLIVLEPKYNVSGLDTIFNKVIRNGTAHFFLVKAGITVTKDGKHHLGREVYEKNTLNVDLKILHADFVRTYDRVKSDIVGSALFYQAGFDEFHRQMSAAESLIQGFLKSAPSGPGALLNLAQFGASGPTQISGTNTTASGNVNPVSGTTTLPPKV